MVNNNIQGVIPINGTGFTVRRHGDFKPGEMKRLSNVEVLEEKLVNRRPIKSAYSNSVDVLIPQVDNPFGFIGNLRNWSILTTETTQKAYGTSSPQTMWAPTELDVPVAVGSFHKLIGYFRYNNKNYWLTLEFDAGTSITLKLFHGNIDLDNDVPETYDAAYFATLTETDIVTIVGASVDYNKFAFRNFFIQGNRLWVVTSVGVYFSKATDPTVFAVPDGGFFRFPDEKINWGMSLRSSVYVLCDNSIHVINYTSDPNTDATVQVISDNMGADRGVIFQDTPVVVNQLGLFNVVNGYVDKIVDNEFDIGLDYYHNSLAAFGDYLILGKYLNLNYEKASGDSNLGRVNLCPNPSFETDLTGYGAGTAYMERTRSGDEFLHGAWALKVKKINDAAVVSRTNLIETPSFETEVFGPFWTESGAGELDVVDDTSVEGDWCLRFKYDGSLSTSAELSSHSGNNYIMPAVAGQTFRLNIKTRRNSEMSGNRYLKVAPKWYTAAHTLISTGTAQSIKPTTNGTWQGFEWSWVAPALAEFVTLSITTDVTDGSPPGPSWAFRFDQIIFENISGDVIGGFDSPKYFDGETADVGTQYTFEWEGTTEESPSFRKGYDGPIADQYKIFDFTSFIAVAADTSYTIGANFLLEDSDKIDLTVEQYTAGDVLISSGTAQIGETVGGVFTFLHGSFITASNCAKIKFKMAKNSPIMFDEIVWVDGVLVELTSTFTGTYFDGDSVDTPAATYAWSGVAHASTSTATFSNIPRKLFKEGRYFTPGLEGNDLGYNLYFLNMINGSVHVVEFTDGKDAVTPGYIVGVFVNNNKDDNGNYKVMFLTNRLVSETGSSYTTKGNVYYMDSYRELFFEDSAARSNGQMKHYAPKVDIEIDSYVPDGSEYLVKKFRNLEIMGKVPTQDINVQFGYDNAPYTDPIDISRPDEATLRPHDPARVGINQRARSLSVRISNEDYNTALDPAVDYGVLEISDLRVLWGYTGRSPDRKFADVT